MLSPAGPIRFLVVVIAVGVLIIVAVMLIMSESRAVQIIGAAVLGMLLILAFVPEFILVRENEKHVEKYPELLKNEAIGETVTALGSFECIGDSSTGLVVLNGERWKASCAGSYVPRDGERLIVRGRERLTLDVQPQDSDI